MFKTTNKFIEVPVEADGNGNTYPLGSLVFSCEVHQTPGETWFPLSHVCCVEFPNLPT